MIDELISADHLARLKWRARRGLLENDLIVTRFFAQHTAISIRDAEGLEALFALTDNELLELILARKEPDAAQAQPALLGALDKLRKV